MSVDKYLEERARRKDGAIPRGAYFHKPEKIAWSKTRCQNKSCQKIVQYVPKKGWDGRLICPKCGTEFRVPSLEKFF